MPEAGRPGNDKLSSEREFRQRQHVVYRSGTRYRVDPRELHDIVVFGLPEKPMIPILATLPMLSQLPQTLPTSQHALRDRFAPSVPGKLLV
jgi:hypothetical protein